MNLKIDSKFVFRNKSIIYDTSPLFLSSNNNSLPSSSESLRKTLRSDLTHELVNARRRRMREVKKGKWPRVLYLWKKGKRRRAKERRIRRRREREKWKGLVTKERAKLVVGPIQTFLSKFEGPRGSTSRNLFSRIPPFKWPGVCSPGLVSFHCSRLIFEARPECPLHPASPRKG